MPNKYAALLNNVRESKPLVHHITNYVTVNDCANITLGIGASLVNWLTKKQDSWVTGATI